MNRFVPTHMSRNERLAESGKEWLKAGGYVDFTADGEDVGDYVADYLSMYLLSLLYLFTLVLISFPFCSFYFFFHFPFLGPFLSLNTRNDVKSSD